MKTTILPSSGMECKLLYRRLQQLAAAPSVVPRLCAHVRHVGAGVVLAVMLKLSNSSVATKADLTQKMQSWLGWLFTA